MYAEIKHQPDAARTFWFVVPPELQHGIQEGDRVEVQTRHGKKGGIVVNWRCRCNGSSMRPSLPNHDINHNVKQRCSQGDSCACAAL